MQNAQRFAGNAVPVYSNIEGINNLRVMSLFYLLDALSKNSQIGARCGEKFTELVVLEEKGVVTVEGYLVFPVFERVM